MAQKKNSAKAKPRARPSGGGIWIITDVDPTAAAAPEYFGATQIPRSAAELADDWKAFLSKVSRVIEQSGPAAAPSGFQLEQIEVSLGVTAEGGLAFIAKAGVQASIKVVLKRS